MLFVLGEEERAGVWVLKTESDGGEKKRRKWDIEKGKHKREERETESNRERHWSLLVDLTHPHALVPIPKQNFKKGKKKL